MTYHIVVCASVVPDPLQTLEPVSTPNGPALKNEAMLPAILDPWAASALYEGGELAKKTPGSKLWLVSLAPKPKLQQVMMTVAKKLPLELVAVDGPAGGFVDSFATAEALAAAIKAIPGIEMDKLLIFGGWESASRAAGTTLQTIGELLGVVDQFEGVDKLTPQADGSLEVLERVEGGRHQISTVSAAPALFGWATGELGEPANNPQVGMANMRTIMPALAKAAKFAEPADKAVFAGANTPKQQRETRVVKDMPVDEIAREIVQWIGEE